MEKLIIFTFSLHYVSHTHSAYKLINNFKRFFNVSQVLTKYIHRLGVSPLWSLTDIFGLEPEQLEWVAKPVKAVILLCNTEIVSFHLTRHVKFSLF